MSGATGGEVVLVEYDERWPAFFDRERERLRAALGEAALAIEHVGSTAVPGLAAKPIIDILVGVDTLDRGRALIEPVVALGYEYIREYEAELPFRRYFRRHPDEEMAPGIAHAGWHLHMVERRHRFFDDHVAFRDHLRAHPEDARAYERLKRELAERFRTERDGYTDGKDDFVRDVLARTQPA